MLTANFMAASAGAPATATPVTSSPASPAGTLVGLEALPTETAASFEALMEMNPLGPGSEEEQEPALADEAATVAEGSAPAPAGLSFLPVMLLQMGMNPLTPEPAANATPVAAVATGPGLGVALTQVGVQAEAAPKPATPAAATPSAVMPALASDTAAATSMPMPADSLKLPPMQEAQPALTISLPLSNPEQQAVNAMPANTTLTAPATGNSSAGPMDTTLTLTVTDGQEMADAVAAKIGWMTDQNVTRAEIRVSAPDMGDIDIRLALDGAQVSAEFASQTSEVRALVEANMPRLKDMLQSQGMQLVRADVGGSFQQQNQQQAPQQQAGSAPAFDGGGDHVGAPALAPVRHQRLIQRDGGLLDAYA